ncbi:unnamed protein product [Rangifer tarandus platyrhynchus]|uniref:Basic proline-rich protein-like n=1 Tax=Rangifer tarandus platyrhynchus TaxID=3082113 RepID=A0ABN8YNE4_RANTA|nr:unnamed protein product [Rangifer tarandus platyrhynchus]
MPFSEVSVRRPGSGVGPQFLRWGPVWARVFPAVPDREDPSQARAGERARPGWGRLCGQVAGGGVGVAPVPAPETGKRQAERWARLQPPRPTPTPPSGCGPRRPEARTPQGRPPRPRPAARGSEDPTGGRAPPRPGRPRLSPPGAGARSPAGPLRSARLPLLPLRRPSGRAAAGRIARCRRGRQSGRRRPPLAAQPSPEPATSRSGGSAACRHPARFPPETLKTRRHPTAGARLLTRLWESAARRPGNAGRK